MLAGCHKPGQEWCKHRMSREQLVGITGQRVHADGGREILVEGQEDWQVWEEWTGQGVEDTEWRKKIKGQWRAKEQAVMRWDWRRDEVQDKYKVDKDRVDRDKVYDRG